MDTNHVLKTGTITGTVLSIIPTLFYEEIVRTILLALTGAVVSFLATYFLKWLTSRREK